MGVVSENVRDRALGLIQDLSAQLRQAGAPAVEPPYDDLVEVVEGVRSDVSKVSPHVLVSWTVFDEPDEYEYVHPFDVAVFSVAIALAMGERARIVDIGLGALLHDVGMALVPGAADTAYREGEGLAPEDAKEMHAHPELGVRVLRQHPRISAFTKAIVAQHHERMDGSGYPRGLRGSDIHVYSRIVACADVYSSMLVRSHLDRHMMPGEVVEYMMSAAGFEFDKDVVRVMLGCVSPFPEGALVRLSTGELAVVTRLSRGMVTRPVVRLTREENGTLVETDAEIDLARPEHQTTLITAIE
ncbi:MAG: HD domain-containing phosphohydrolase [Bacillota bacterium]|nr:HD domain-containing phosphohydrolase [Bacillota bacterium]